MIDKFDTDAWMKAYQKKFIEDLMKPNLFTQDYAKADRPPLPEVIYKADTLSGQELSLNEEGCLESTDWNYSDGNYSSIDLTIEELLELATACNKVAANMLAKRMDDE